METLWTTMKSILSDYYFICLMSMIPHNRPKIPVQSKLTKADFETRKLKFENDKKLAEENKNTATNLEHRVNELNKTQCYNFSNFDFDAEN